MGLCEQYSQIRLSLNIYMAVAVCFDQDDCAFLQSAKETLVICRPDHLHGTYDADRILVVRDVMGEVQRRLNEDDTCTHVWAGSVFSRLALKMICEKPIYYAKNPKNRNKMMEVHNLYRRQFYNGFKIFTCAVCLDSEEQEEEEEEEGVVEKSRQLV
ncbi:hypothetical protein RF55_26319, partial [Lasius niger]